MTTPIEGLSARFFLGVLSKAAWELARRAWERLSRKPLEELYVEAFKGAVDNARPRLTKHARDGEVELDEEALRKVLRAELGPSLGRVTPAAVRDERFLTELAGAMHERSVVIIGGHNLTRLEYVQLASNLAREAATRFEDSVTRDAEAFRRALLREESENASTVQEVLGVLEELMYRIDSLETPAAKRDTIPGEVSRHREAAKYPAAASAALRAQRIRLEFTDALVVTGVVGEASPAVTVQRTAPDKPPLTPAICAPRGDRVAELGQALQTATWLALVDGPGKGKSQLARAVAERRSAPLVCWIALRGRSGTDAELHIEAQMIRWLAKLKGDDATSAGTQISQHNLIHVAQLVSECTGEDGFLIVDDLPDPIDNEGLFERLCWTAAGLAQHGAKMLTTSQRPLPPNVLADVGPALHVTDAGSFTTTDVLHMLESAGAPNDARTEGIATLILTSTVGHPSLIAAEVAWLGERGWSLDEDTLMDLLTGEPGEPVRELERRRMLRLVDEPSRDLLYRLSLVEEGFDRQLALVVSTVSSPIPDPGILLDELRGPWVEPTGRDRLEVTPLLRGVGRDNLPAEMQKAVHRAVAEQCLSQGTVDASQAHSVALHLWNAELYEDFAHFLIGFLLAADTPAKARYILWASSLISPSMEWPHGLSLDLRIMFRAVQVRTCLLAGRDASGLDADLESLMAQAGAESSRALVFACLNTGLLLPVEDLEGELILPRAVRAVRLLRQEPIVDGTDFPGRLEDIIWLAAFRIKRPTQVGQFLDELGAMTGEERRLLFESALACECTTFALDRVWHEEVDRPDCERDWSAVLGFLEQAQVLGASLKAMPLVVACARARAIVLADYLRQSDEALGVLEGVPEPGHYDLSLLLHYTAGCILLDAGRTREALDRLDAGSATPGDGFGYYRYHAEFQAAIAESKLGLYQAARRRIPHVIRLAPHRAALPTYERLEIMGELAWVHWATGAKVRACASMYGLVTSLVALNEPTDSRYREVFNKAGHALGWFSSIARSGEPPKVTDSGEKYAPVEAGFFGVRRERMGEFTPRVGFSRSWLLAQLGMLADSVGLRRLGKRAYEMSQRLAEGRKADEVLLVFVDAELAALQASFGRLDEALEVVFRASDGLAVHGYGPHADQIFSATTDHVTHDEAPALSPEDARSAEHQLLLGMFVGPALAGLLAALPTSDLWIARLAHLHGIVSTRRHSFRDEGLAETILGFTTALIELWKGHAVPGEPAVANDDGFMKALWFLVESSHPTTKLRDALRMQVLAVDFLVRISDARLHLLPDLGAFLHRFWLHIARTRGFALTSPELFRQELHGLSSQGGARTAAKVLLAACRAVGLQLPTEIKLRLEAV